MRSFLIEGFIIILMMLLVLGCTDVKTEEDLVDMNTLSISHIYNNWGLTHGTNSQIQLVLHQGARVTGISSAQIVDTDSFATVEKTDGNKVFINVNIPDNITYGVKFIPIKLNYAYEHITRIKHVSEPLKSTTTTSYYKNGATEEILYELQIVPEFQYYLLRFATSLIKSFFLILSIIVTWLFSKNPIKYMYEGKVSWGKAGGYLLLSMFIIGLLIPLFEVVFSITVLDIKSIITNVISLVFILYILIFNKTNKLRIKIVMCFKTITLNEIIKIIIYSILFVLIYSSILATIDFFVRNSTYVNGYMKYLYIIYLILIVPMYYISFMSFRKKIN